MFLENLSDSIGRICRARHLSYEAASELCGLSARYFGDIVRGRTSPTIQTLEKLCLGLERSPNELLLVVGQSREILPWDRPLGCDRPGGPLEWPDLAVLRRGGGPLVFQVGPLSAVAGEEENLPVQPL